MKVRGTDADLEQYAVDFAFLSLVHYLTII